MPLLPILARTLEGVLEETLAASRVVVLAGPRQTGKSTLAQALCSRLGGTYLSLDNATELAAAQREPEAFLQRTFPLVVDEFQRAGEGLLLAVKAAVDRDRRRGRFLLTGSTRFLSLPTLSESLAGRVALVEMGPFTQGELAGTRDRFLDRLFAGRDALLGIPCSPPTRADVFERICAGGYPEARTRAGRSRRRWFSDYARTVTQRDVADFSRARRLGDLPRLLRLLAARTAQELVTAKVAAELGMPRTTLDGYLPLLDAVYLTTRLSAWAGHPRGKAVHHPKLHLVDAGLAAALTDATPAKMEDPAYPMTGALLETFVVGELLRQRAWAEVEVELAHFRDRDGAEVDVVVEAPDGRTAGIEVKTASSVNGHDFRGLETLARRLGKKFVVGCVLYLGPRAHPFGDRLAAVPVSALWAP